MSINYLLFLLVGLVVDFAVVLVGDKMVVLVGFVEVEKIVVGDYLVDEIHLSMMLVKSVEKMVLPLSHLLQQPQPFLIRFFTLFKKNRQQKNFSETKKNPFLPHFVVLMEQKIIFFHLHTTTSVPLDGLPHEERAKLIQPLKISVAVYITNDETDEGSFFVPYNNEDNSLVFLNIADVFDKVEVIVMNNGIEFNWIVLSKYFVNVDTSRMQSWQNKTLDLQQVIVKKLYHEFGGEYRFPLYKIFQENGWHVSKRHQINIQEPQYRTNGNFEHDISNYCKHDCKLLQILFRKKSFNVKLPCSHKIRKIVFQ